MTQDELIKELDFPDYFPGQEDSQRYYRFLQEVCRDNQVHQITLSFPIPDEDPLCWFSRYKSQYAFNYYWESPADEEAVAALGSVRELSSRGTERFRTIETSLSKAKSENKSYDFFPGDAPSMPFWVGGFSFFNELKKTTWKGFKPAYFTLPELSFIKKNGNTTACITLSMDSKFIPETLHDRIIEKISSFPLNKKGEKAYSFKSDSHKNQIHKLTSEEELQQWIESVKKIKNKINRKEVEKIVLARQLQIRIADNFEASEALHSLRSTYPGCTTFLIKNEASGTFMGSSPEQLLSVNGETIKTDALAGSIGRGKNDFQDKYLESKLFGSTKNQKEHSYVVQSIKKSLSPFLNTLQSAGRPMLKKLLNVQHLYTPIKGKIKNHTTPFTLLEHLHPTPAMGGTPRDEALSYIRKNERFERGWFASPIGWITTDGQARFNVAIRSGLIKEQTARLFAGCGIVEDSNPEDEWDETNLKFKPMLSALRYE